MLHPHACLIAVLTVTLLKAYVIGMLPEACTATLVVCSNAIVWNVIIAAGVRC